MFFVFTMILVNRILDQYQYESPKRSSGNSMGVVSRVYQLPRRPQISIQVELLKRQTGRASNTHCKWYAHGPWGHILWANYSDLSRGHPKRWFNKGIFPKCPKHSGLGIKYSSLSRIDNWLIVKTMIPWYLLE